MGQHSTTVHSFALLRDALLSSRRRRVQVWCAVPRFFFALRRPGVQLLNLYIMKMSRNEVRETPVVKRSSEKDQQVAGWLY